MTLHSSVRDRVTVTSLTYSMESSMSKIAYARLLRVQETVIPEILPACHQTDKICRLYGHKEGGCAIASPRTPKSSTKIESPKFLG